MNSIPVFPAFDDCFPELNQFILELAGTYKAGKTNSWEALEEKVQAYFTAQRLDDMEARVPGWRKLASDGNGVTLTHVMCVFLGLAMLPEFQALSETEQQLAKWIVLFHDVAKELKGVGGGKDKTHAFRSAVLAARQLPPLGFEATRAYDRRIDTWSELTYSATKNSPSFREPIQDNGQLPDILLGIEEMFGEDMPGALVVKCILFHMSINVVNDWPQAAPLTEDEIKRYITIRLVPLLKVMMLSDNEGWVMFAPEREQQRNETLQVFEKVEQLISDEAIQTVDHPNIMANLRTTVILKTDIVDSTPRTAGQTQSEMGSGRKQHKQFLVSTASKHLGSIFQEEGDGYLIEFPSVTSAALAAVEMQQSLRSTQIGKGEKQRLAIRIVITVGDILYQEANTIGTTLSLTARIEKITPPDEIYLSQAAWLILNKAEVQTEYVNEFDLKGFNQPEKIYKVLQKPRTHVLTDHFIVYSDANNFIRFINSASIEEIESFLLDCDDLINAVCDTHGGIIRQIDGDQYFFTFTDAQQTIAAIEELCHAWKKIVERYTLGISIGIHKGNLNAIRSFVYGADISTTLTLTALGKLYRRGQDEIQVIVSRKVRDEFQERQWEGKFVEVDPSEIVEPTHQRIVQEHGAFEFVPGDDLQS